MAYAAAFDPGMLGHLTLARFRRLCERERGPSLSPETRAKQDAAGAVAVAHFRAERARRNGSRTAL